MDFNEFNETWPDYREGESFANRFKLDLLEKQRKALPTGSWLWWGVPIAVGAARFFGASWTQCASWAAVLVAFEIVDLLARILRQNHELRTEVEMLKGAIRENRWLIESRNRMTLTALRHDEFGQPIHD